MGIAHRSAFLAAGNFAFVRPPARVALRSSYLPESPSAGRQGAPMVMFAGLPYITVYWLSGFSENQYEIWDSKKVSIVSTADSLSFSAYLAWPQEVADEAHLTIRRTDAGLVFSTDWFPDEEFDLQLFASRDDGGLILMSKYLRETFFIHLRQQYE